MLNSGQKKNILTLVLSEKKILNETKNHGPPFKLNDRSLRNGQFNLILKKNIVFSIRDRQHPPVYFGLNGDENDEIDNHSSWNNISIISYMENTYR